MRRIFVSSRQRDEMFWLQDLKKKDTLLAFVIAIALSYIRWPDLCSAVSFSTCFVVTFLPVKQCLGL